MPKLWWAIGECETGLDTHHATQDYVGAFGFARSTWAGFRGSYPWDATRASLWQQWQVALRVYRRYGLGGWGCYTGGGYLVWMRK